MKPSSDHNLFSFKRPLPLEPAPSVLKRPRFADTSLNDSERQVFRRPLLLTNKPTPNRASRLSTFEFSRCATGQQQMHEIVDTGDGLRSNHQMLGYIDVRSNEEYPPSVIESANLIPTPSGTLPLIIPRCVEIPTPEGEVDGFINNDPNASDYEYNGKDDSFTLEMNDIQNLDASRCEHLIVISNIPSYIQEKDIRKLIYETGLSSSVVEIVEYPDRTVSARFTHAHLADAAFSVLRLRNIPFPWRSRFRQLSIERRRNQLLPSTRIELEPSNIDLSEASLSDMEISSDDLCPKKDTHGSYDDLRTDIYEDSSSDSSDTMITPPLRPQALSRCLSATNLKNIPSLDKGATIRSALDSNSSSEDFSAEDSTSSNSDAGSQDNPVRRITYRKRRVYISEESSMSGDEDRQPDPRPRRIVAKKELVAVHAPPHSLPEREGGSSTITRNLPSTPHNRARRIVIPTSSKLPLVTVSMRADVNFFRREAGYRISAYSLPCETSQRVVDACAIGDTIILGFGRGTYQISFIPLVQDEKPFMTGLRHCPHRETTTPKSTNRTESLSSLAPVHSDGRIIKFITGGHDKKVILWTARGFAATSEVITRCSTVPITLNFCDRTVMCGTGMRLLTLDIEHRTAKPTSIKFSNPVLQVHVHPDAPTISIVEVKSIDEQILVYDARKNHSLDRPADIRFGYRSKGFEASRYYRGSARFSYFARGYTDGCVCIWDYRNVKTPVLKAKSTQSHAVVHAMITNKKVACYADDSLTYIDFEGNIL